MKRIIIRNRDFSILKGLESKNEFGMYTKICHMRGGSIELEEKDENGMRLASGVHISNVSDRYIIKRLAQYGFEIEFYIKEINTFTEFKQFLKENDLRYTPSCNRSVIDLSGRQLTTDMLKDEFNVNINLEI